MVLTQPMPKIVLRPEDISRALSVTDPDHSLPEVESFDVEGQEGRGLQPGHSHVRVGVQLQRASEDLGDESEEDTFWTSGRELREYEEEDLQDWGPVDEDVEWDVRDKDDIRGQVDEFAEDARNVSEDGPADESEKGAQPVNKATYQFCPLPHRLTILRLFAKHASQHTLLPERHGVPRSAEEIWRDAVEEMYRHCKANNLCEVWAYLWNSWYRRDRWKLWARSAYSAAIPCKRTTMMVEALWRNLKRLVLHLYNRPPVDLVVYMIVTRTLPPYRVTLRSIIADARPGRARTLTHMQKALKRSWKRLSSVPIKGSYNTRLVTWTCDCGAQKYHAYILCKHLVQAAGVQSPKWWAAVTRYRIPPFYTVPVNGIIPTAPETQTPHAWLDRMSLNTVSLPSILRPVTPPMSLKVSTQSDDTITPSSQVSSILFALCLSL